MQSRDLRKWFECHWRSKKLFLFPAYLPGLKSSRFTVCLNIIILFTPICLTIDGVSQSNPTDAHSLHGEEQLISAHQNEVSQLADIAGIDLHQSWNSTRLEICPVFANHIFVRYQHPSLSDVTFIVVYPRMPGEFTSYRWELVSSNECNLYLQGTAQSEFSMKYG